MGMQLSSQDKPWFYSALAITILIGLPIISVFYLALFPSENVWSHLIETVLPFYLKNTFWLMLGVVSLTFLVGTGAAWLVSMYNFPGKRWLSWALLLPFAVPAYVVAYVYTDILEYAGPVQKLLREVFGWHSARDYYFPEVRSMGGAILMMSLALYPYVYMLARTAFMEQSVSLYRSARSLGSTPWQFFYRISLPMARPAIAVGLALVLMETLNDFGTVDYFAVQTLSAGLYDTWLNMSNLGGAAQIACVMIAIVVALIYIERHSRRRQKHYMSRNPGDPIPAQTLTGFKALAASCAAALPFLLGFAIPTGVLVHYAIQYFADSWTSKFLGYAFNSFALSSLAAICTLALGTLLAYSKRMNKHPWTHAAIRFSSLGYAVPGAVLAIGVIIPFAAFDNQLDAWARQTLGVSTGLILSGSAFAILFAYIVRFLAVASGSVESSLDKVTQNMDMAARSLGHSHRSVLLRVHLPIIRRGALTAMLVVFVDCMKELPATLILRPFNFDTLATQVYQYASDELLEQSALSALLIVIVGIIPVILLDRTIRSQPQPHSTRTN